MGDSQPGLGDEFWVRPSMTHPDMRAPDEIKRPASCPKEGEVLAFDAGWHAQRLGLERETVFVLTRGRDSWALMGYDIRHELVFAASQSLEREHHEWCPGGMIGDPCKHGVHSPHPIVMRITPWDDEPVACIETDELVQPENRLP